MQGIFIRDGHQDHRPKSKKAIKEAIAADPSRVQVEATSMFGNEYDGPLSEMPDGRISFVGPDPYTKRNFYGTIIKSGSTIKIS